MRQELIKARAKAESELNDYLSHEIRNPLVIIESMVDNMVKDTKSGVSDVIEKKTVMKDVDLIQSNIKYMRRLLCNLLDLNKFMEGKIKLNPSIHNLKTSFDNLYNMNNIDDIVITNKLDIDLRVAIDNTRFEQIMLNLINNTIKFLIKTKGDKKKEDNLVNIGCDILRERDDSYDLLVYIEDSGP